MMTSPLKQKFLLHEAAYHPAANGIRALACLLVLFVHHVAIFFPGSNPYLLGCGRIGVWLFFVLSAYLLTQRFVTRGFSPQELANYALSRFLRIYPAYTFAVIAYAWLGTVGINGKPDVYAALCLQNGFGHLWTIPVEFKFYFVLPLLAFVSSKVFRKFGETGVILFSILAIILHQVLFPYFRLPEVCISTRWYLSCFQLGICSAYISKPISKQVSNALVYSVIIAVFLSTPLARNVLFGVQLSRDLLNKFLWFGTLWAVFIVALLNLKEATILSRILGSKVLTAIGNWSFSIYLCHWYFAITGSSKSPENYSVMIVSLLLSISFGALMFYAIERPFLFLRKRIQNAH